MSKSKSGVDALVRGNRRLPVLSEGAVAEDNTGSFDQPAMVPEDVRTPDSYMRCVPYNATFRAQVCLERQQQAMQPATGRERLFGKANVSRCKDCELGKSVVATIAARKRIARRKSST